MTESAKSQDRPQDWPKDWSMQEETPQRARIRGVAAGLFAARGYAAIGVAEIGEAVGLARGALYHHIGSKEELLYNIVIRYIGELVRTGQTIAGDLPDPVARIRCLSRHLMRVISAHINEMTVCFREVNALTGERHAIVSRLHADYQAIWADAIREGAEAGVFRPVPPVALKGLLGMYFYSFLWLDPNGRYAPEEIADIFSDLVFRALALDGPPEAAPRKPSQQ